MILRQLSGPLTGYSPKDANGKQCRVNSVAPGGMVVIVKVKSPNQCYGLSSGVPFVKLLSGECHRISLMISEH